MPSASSYVAKEATQSSRIEGTQTTIEDAFKQAADLDPEQRDDWAEVQNYIQAVNHAIGRLADLPLSNRLLRETHAVLLQSVRGTPKRPGEFRVSQNWIGVSLKNAVFVPPRHDRVPDLMSDMERFLHDRDIMIPLLIRIAIAHYQFETIHPFLDGNGKLGRLMISPRRDCWSGRRFICPTISSATKRHTSTIAPRCRTAITCAPGSSSSCTGVEETARNAAGVFRSILRLKERIERDVLPRFGARHQDTAHALMRQIYARPVVDVKAAAEILGSTVNTASSLINDLVTDNVLVEVTGRRRNRLFLFQDYISLFRR